MATMISVDWYDLHFSFYISYNRIVYCNQFVVLPFRLHLAVINNVKMQIWPDFRCRIL